MDKNTLANTMWECKYHIVFAPKYRRQVIYGRLKRISGKYYESCVIGRDRNNRSRTLPGSHIHAGENTAQIQCIRNNGVFEGKKLTNNIRPPCESEIQVWQQALLL